MVPCVSMDKPNVHPTVQLHSCLLNLRTEKLLQNWCCTRLNAVTSLLCLMQQSCRSAVRQISDGVYVWQVSVCLVGKRSLFV